MTDPRFASIREAYGLQRRLEEALTAQRAKVSTEARRLHSGRDGGAPMTLREISEGVGVAFVTVDRWLRRGSGKGG